MSPPNGLSVGVHRRRTPTDGKEDKRSWIEPPAEPKGITLTQAQIESCMQTYEARPFSCAVLQSVSLIQIHCPRRDKRSHRRWIFVI